MDKKKICFVTAAPITARAFLKSHMAALGETYAVHYVCNADAGEVSDVPCSEFQKIEIERGFAIAKDLKALGKLYSYFKAQKFAAVHSVTPKAGLLTALAGWMARIPVRIHIFTGQVWATRKGYVRWLLKSLDKLIVRLDTHILTDGKSQRAFLEKERVVKKEQAIVFADGSIRGVDTQLFRPDEEARRQIREEIGIKDDMLVYLFVGRLNREKGVGELFEAFERLASDNKDVFLLMAGWDEEKYVARVHHYPHIDGTNFRFYGFTPTPEKLYNAGDVCVLPTYREGFVNSVLEAASVGLPAIISDAYGALDAIVEGETGLRCKVGDVETLYDCMRYLSEHRDSVKRMGTKSRERMQKVFPAERITACWVEFYHSLLDK